MMLTVRYFVLNLRKDLLTALCKKWQNDLETYRVLTTLKYFITFTFENYLNWLPIRLRVPLSKPRLSSHTLRIETGRYGQARVEKKISECGYLGQRSLRFQS